jgi:hypothetical protein
MREGYRATSPMYIALERVIYHNRTVPKGHTFPIRGRYADALLKAGKIAPVQVPYFTDIFKSDAIKFPEQVTILGTGPNGRAAYDRIQDSDFVIAVNTAINIPVRASLWMAMDGSLKEQAGFQNAMRKHYIDPTRRKDETGWTKILRDFQGQAQIGWDFSESALGSYAIPVMEHNSIARHFPWVRFIFSNKRLEGRENFITAADPEPREGFARNGTTISGSAIQLCYWKGVRRIVLCGIDMAGDIYFDGTRHKEGAKRAGAWKQIRNFNALIGCLERKGMEFVSLSDTKLDVRKI